MAPKISLFKSATDFLTFEPGQIVFEAGQPGDKMYVINEGEVEVVVNGQVVDTSGEGSIVGEMALIDSSPRSATVRAKTQAKLVPVDEKRFLYMVQQTPGFAINVMKILAERMRNVRK